MSEAKTTCRRCERVICKICGYRFLCGECHEAAVQAFAKTVRRELRRRQSERRAVR